MHAIAWELKEKSPQTKIVYLSAEQFMYRFVQALRDKGHDDLQAALPVGRRSDGRRTFSVHPPARMRPRRNFLPHVQRTRRFRQAGGDSRRPRAHGNHRYRGPDREPPAVGA